MKYCVHPAGHSGALPKISPIECEIVYPDGSVSCIAFKRDGNGVMRKVGTTLATKNLIFDTLEEAIEERERQYRKFLRDKLKSYESLFRSQDDFIIEAQKYK